MRIAVCRGVYFVVEQPIRSSLYELHSFKTALEVVGAKRFVTSMAAFGGASLKPLELWTTFPSDAMCEFVARSNSQGWKALEYTSMILPGFKVALVLDCSPVLKRPSTRKSKSKSKSHSASPQKKQRVRRVFCGSLKKLKDSSAYEGRFCAAVCQMFIAVREAA